MSEKPRYSLREWLRLEPVADFLKRYKYDSLLGQYLSLEAVREKDFLVKYSALKGKNVVLIVAFEQPLALSWMLGSMRRFMSGCEVLVFDNSRDEAIRLEVEKVCSERGVGYLAMPANSMKHPNRSHGMAMTWIYHRIIRKIAPNFFGYADHDMVLFRPLDLMERISSHQCFGVLNRGTSSWNLWAGYCFFRFAAVEKVKLNFLNDFSRNLDTGGRNWTSFYQNVGTENVRFSSRVIRPVIGPVSGEQRQVEIVDQSWMHIGSISYNDNFRGKREFFSEIVDALNAGAVWSDLLPDAAEVDAPSVAQ